MLENHVEVGVMNPTSLLPLDLRESSGPLTELAWVLESELLWGECATSVIDGGLGAAAVSIMGGGRLLGVNC